MFNADMFEVQDHWTTPKVTVEVKEYGRMVLDCYNSTLCLFGNGYGYMNHIWHVADDGEGYRFTSDELLEHFMGDDYPKVYLPYPTIAETDAYIRSMMQTVDGELEEM